MKTTNSGAIDFSRFFRMYDPLASRPFRIASEQDWVGPREAWQLFGGEWQAPEPVRFRAYKGGAPSDFLWTGFVPLICISQRVVELLESNRFTGWATYPVEVYGRKGEPLPGYCGFAIKSSAGEPDVSRSQVITKAAIVPGGKPPEMYKGLYFDESKWDGSDIFRVIGFKVVTGRVVEAFKRAKVTNVRFTPLPEVETDVNIYRIGEKRD